MSVMPIINRALVRVRQAFAPREQFPRIMLHEGCTGRGRPLVSDGVLDDAVARRIARFNYWCVSPVDLYDLYPHAIRRVREMNPRIRILAHVLGPIFWQSSVGWAGRVYAAINERTLLPGYADITNDAVRDGLLTCYGELLRSGLFDGLMLDNMSFSDSWRDSAFAPLDPLLRHAKGQMFAMLHDRFPKATLIGNAGPRGLYPGGEKAHGWWRENFPFQNDGGGWAANMLEPRGLLTDTDYYVLKPTQSVIATTAGNAERARALFALASSCLGEGIFVWGPGNFDPAIRYMDWWLPEYGDATTYGGWLGAAKGPARRLEVFGQEEVWVRDFDFGRVLVWPAMEYGVMERT